MSVVLSPVHDTSPSPPRPSSFLTAVPPPRSATDGPRLRKLLHDVALYGRSPLSFFARRSTSELPSAARERESERDGEDGGTGGVAWDEFVKGL